MDLWLICTDCRGNATCINMATGTRFRPNDAGGVHLIFPCGHDNLVEGNFYDWCKAVGAKDIRKTERKGKLASV